VTLSLSHTHTLSRLFSCLILLQVWGPFFGGNFWVASCSYIRQLIPPKLINQTMTEQLVPALHEMQQRGKLLASNLLPVVGPFALGTGRYSHEHWVGGHGTIRPCDVVEVTSSILEEEEEERRGKNATAGITTHRTTTTTTSSATTQKKLQRKPAPREPLKSTKWYGLKPSRTSRVLQNKHLRLREYFLLPGYLFRLHVLYPQQGPPTNDSWVWTWVRKSRACMDSILNLYFLSRYAFSLFS
jgi:hypothetical protein